MKLFNKLYLFLFVALAFACDPYEDTFQEIEESAPGPIANIEITLTEDDYALLEEVEGAENAAQYGNFSSDEDVREFVPIILNQKYPLFDNKSLVTVNYDFYRGRAPEVYTYSNADQYEVSEEDYNSLDGDAAAYNVFTADQPANDFLPVLLANNFPEATEGDIKLATYQYAEEVNDPSVNILMDTDQYQSLVDYTENERGEDWLDSFGTLEYYFGSNSYFRNFDGRIDRRKGYIEDNNLNDDLFEGSADATEDSIRIEERTIEGLKTFLEINYPNAVPEVNGADKFYFINYAVFYGNTTVEYYAKFQATSVAPNLEFELVEGPSVMEMASSTNSQDRGAFYTFDGEIWEKDESAYYLSSSDYDEMGAPGRFDNFSSSVSPSDYLPALIQVKYPYVQDEEEIVIVYKYFSDGEVSLRGDFYTYTNSEWSVYGSVIEEQLQFAKEEGVWVPDNTIAYTLTGADYELIGDIAIENGDVARGENVQQYGNFYQNFPGGDTHWTDEQLVAIFDQFLKIKYPDLGPGQKFTITYLAYTGSAVELQMNLIQNEEGNYVINE